MTWAQEYQYSDCGLCDRGGGRGSVLWHKSQLFPLPARQWYLQACQLLVFEFVVSESISVESPIEKGKLMRINM